MTLSSKFAITSKHSPPSTSGIVNGNRHRIRHRVPQDRILGKTTRQQGLLERSHLDGPDSCAPDLTSGPYLILKEHISERLSYLFDQKKQENVRKA